MIVQRIADTITRSWHSKLLRVNSLLADSVYLGYYLYMVNRVSKAEIKRIAAEVRREFASMGGRARAENLTKARKREIASMGGKAGGRGRKKKVSPKAA